MAAAINIIGMWGGVLPYFAAMAQILKTDLETTSMIWILIYYNLVFALPLISFIVLRIMLRDKTTVILSRITVFFSHWGMQNSRTLTLSIGPLLIADDANPDIS
jgi:hypothetical protein